MPRSKTYMSAACEAGKATRRQIVFSFLGIHGLHFVIIDLHEKVVVGKEEGCENRRAVEKEKERCTLFNGHDLIPWRPNKKCHQAVVKKTRGLQFSNPHCRRENSLALPEADKYMNL